MFSGRAGDAAALLDSLAGKYGRAPLYHLTRARVYRESLPVDDERKDVVKRMAEPVYEDLEIVISECSRRIDAGEDNPRLLLYRGWAWMFKSHIRTFERSFWTAGRDAKKGKKDLRNYLEKFPDDPIANGIMGAFLYFADTLPAAFKFISRLLFMPTGDREEGLRLMMASAASPSYIEVDNKTLLYSVYMAFEGRYEDGLAGFERLRRRYPHYSAFVRPFAITLPFTPRERRQTIDMIEGILMPEDAHASWDTETGSCNMLRFSRAYADRFYDPPEGARQFRELIADAPEHPDWVTSFSNFELARQLAAQGDVESARKHLRAVLEDDAGAYLHGETRAMLDELDDEYEPSALSGIDVAEFYAGDRDDLPPIIDRLRTHKPSTVQTDFYLGEAFLLNGDDDAALDAFYRVVERDVPVWDESFQMIACSRVAEIEGARLQFETAVRYLDLAPRFYHKEFLYDWLLEGRKRYFERVASGEERSTPTLFSAVP
jgi:tetratricopeptide (TPR) repeat protein